MLRRIRVKRLPSLLLLCLLAAATEGQTVDPDLWGGGVTNPSGQQAVPIVAYEQATGIVFVNTLGINQVLETNSGTLIGGDDVGLIALSVNAGCANEVLLHGFIDQSIGGIVVNGMCFLEKQQLFGVPAGAQYLEPSRRLEIFRYDPGLSPSDFYTVEMAVNFALGEPGATLFGRIQFVPDFTDLNGDGLADCQDVDALSNVIATGVFDDHYDANNDGVVNQSDLQVWLEQAGRRAFGDPLRLGDADLNGRVDARDFHIWNAHRFTHQTGYCAGNFNADDVIDVADFNIWSENKFHHSRGAIVPEPTAANLIVYFGGCLWIMAERFRCNAGKRPS